jgi:non-specific serine/threonine protein kinase
MDADSYAARIAAVCTRLGTQHYERARASGFALSPTEAATLALEAQAEAAGVVTETSDRNGVRLTQREREVAALLAKGLTNRQIAEALVITPGTAALHVEHLRAKLGCHSRAQVAAWAATHGLTAYVPREPHR